MASSDLFDGLGRIYNLVPAEANGKGLLDWTGAGLGQDKALFGFSNH